MKAKETLLCSLLALAALPCSAINDKDVRTCRAWNKMNDDIQLGYATGFSDGITVGVMAATAAVHSVASFRRITDAYVGPVSVGEVRAGITEICKRPENSLIAISDAQQAFIMRVQGKPRSEIDRTLNIARQMGIKLRDSDQSNK